MLSKDSVGSPLVTIIIPVYNLGDYVRPCLRSVFGQTYGNLEALVIDDGSTDESGELCEELCVGHACAKVLHKPNGGLSSARNFGLERATGDYVLFLDGDDLLDHNAVSTLVRLAIEHETGLVVSGYRKITPSEEYACAPGGACELVSGRELLRRLLLLDGETGSACGKLMSHELAAGVRFPEGRYFEDSGSMASLFRVAGEACVTHDELFGYVTRKGSITGRSHYGKKHMFDAEATARDVAEAVDGLGLEREFKCYQAFSRLRIGSKLGPALVAEDPEAIAFLNEAKASCRSAVGAPGVSAIWRIRLALFSVSPKLHNLAYGIYAKATGRVVA